MFVKFVQPEGRESLHECRDMSATRNNDGSVTFKLEPDGPVIHLRERGETLFILNGDGNTIDSYRLPRPHAAAGQGGSRAKV